LVATVISRRHSDSANGQFTAKAEPGTDAYRDRVAVPVMKAVDGLPEEWRALVHEFGYVEVYVAYVNGWTPEMVRNAAKEGRLKT
jgi:hypothetical protein